MARRREVSLELEQAVRCAFRAPLGARGRQVERAPKVAGRSRLRHPLFFSLRREKRKRKKQVSKSSSCSWSVSGCRMRSTRH